MKDYIYMWSYAYQKSEFYLQLEDDLIAKDDYMEFIVDQLTSVTEVDFEILEQFEIFNRQNLTLI